MRGLKHFSAFLAKDAEYAKCQLHDLLQQAGIADWQISESVFDYMRTADEQTSPPDQPSPQVQAWLKQNIREKIVCYTLLGAVAGLGLGQLLLFVL